MLVKSYPLHWPGVVLYMLLCYLLNFGFVINMGSLANARTGPVPVKWVDLLSIPWLSAWGGITLAGFSLLGRFIATSPWRFAVTIFWTIHAVLNIHPGIATFGYKCILISLATLVPAMAVALGPESFLPSFLLPYRSKVEEMQEDLERTEERERGTVSLGRRQGGWFNEAYEDEQEDENEMGEENEMEYMDPPPPPTYEEAIKSAKLGRQQS